MAYVNGREEIAQVCVRVSEVWVQAVKPWCLPGPSSNWNTVSDWATFSWQAQELTGPCVCMQKALWLYGHACVRLCVKTGACTHVGFCLCVCASHIQRVHACVFGKSPRVAIHLDSLCSPITSLSRHFLTRKSDGRRPEGERDGGRRWMTEGTTDLIGLDAEKCCDTLYSERRERGGRNVMAKTKQTKLINFHMNHEYWFN